MNQYCLILYNNTSQFILTVSGTFRQYIISGCHLHCIYSQAKHSITGVITDVLILLMTVINTNIRTNTGVITD